MIAKCNVDSNSDDVGKFETDLLFSSLIIKDVCADDLTVGQFLDNIEIKLISEEVAKYIQTDF